jgi:hypothetical protein
LLSSWTLTKGLSFSLKLDFFEYKKEEDESGDAVLRDFRITTDPTVWRAFKDDMISNGTYQRIQFAKTSVLVGTTSVNKDGRSGSHSADSKLAVEIITLVFIAVSAFSLQL